jgi:hypothetical protein
VDFIPGEFAAARVRLRDFGEQRIEASEVREWQLSSQCGDAWVVSDADFGVVLGERHS